mgnify:CR=1 FL=1
MEDVQNSKATVELPIQRVGINNLTIPIYISEKGGTQQNTVANVDVYVDLEPQSKGTHMSRLAIGVQKFMGHKLDSNLLIDIAEYIRNKLDAKTAEVIYRFPYFIKKIAPVSKEPGLVHHNIVFDLVLNDKPKFTMSIESTTTSLCPCSKEISRDGAHNQRSKIKLTVQPKNGSFVWIEDLIAISEDCSSCDIYSVLKRPDEKYVTEQAYDNPRFVEDMVRSIFQSLSERDDLESYIVEVTNEESIHQHSAYARMES